MLRRLLFAAIAFLSICGVVGVALANPIPSDPFLSLEPLQYFQIVVAEFCAFVVGTALLVYRNEARWQKAGATLAAALIISYAIGILVWTLGYRMGVLGYYAGDLGFLSLTILVLPEFIGVVVGTVIIHAIQRVQWKTALIVMVVAMLTSVAIGFLFAYLNFSLR